MATISSKVFRHHKKADGTYNVKICIYHKKERVYIDTVHYLTEKLYILLKGRKIYKLKRLK